MGWQPDECSEGKDKHCFKIVVTCEYCNSINRGRLWLSCDWNKKSAYTGEKETFQSRQVGCATCRYSVLMHCHCTPSWDDDDYCTYAHPKTGDSFNIRVSVENID